MPSGIYKRMKSSAQRKASSKSMKFLWKTRRKEMLAGVMSGQRKCHSKKNRIACSIRMKRLWKNKAFRKRVSKAVSKTQKKRWENPTVKMFAHCKSASKAAHKNGAVSKAIRKKWKDKKFAKMVLEKNLILGRLHPSKLQKDVRNNLKDKAGIKLQLDFSLGCYNIDIADVKRKLGIEINGTYWHGLRKKYSKRKRARFIRDVGWKMLHITVKRKDLTEKQYSHCLEFLK